MHSAEALEKSPRGASWPPCPAPAQTGTKSHSQEGSFVQLRSGLKNFVPTSQ